ncbi:MAG: adenylate/guanylate cyclase domain-containing protein, partial [Nevskiales bacterium]
AITYVPFKQVMQWIDSDREKLNSTFRGKPVLLGVIQRVEDRLRVPVPLAALEPLRLWLPGAMVQAQVLRSMLGNGLIQAAAAPLQWALLFAAALLWFGRDWLKAVSLVAFLLGAFALGMLMLWKGFHLELATAMLTALLAYLARFAYEALGGMREKRFLREVFSSYVSPPIMKQILAGKIKPSLSGARRQVTILYSDIRAFTRRSEGLPPEESIALLSEYFSEMTAAVHHCGGTVNKFMGDGLLAIFGAPQALACAEKNSLEAAQEMLLRLARLNQRLTARGMEEVRIGIGLASGQAVLGHVGSDTFHEYTAIGDVVNTAARLEALTKELGYPIICNVEVAEAVGAAGGLVDLGQQTVREHSAQRLYGWNPPLLKQQAG